MKRFSRKAKGTMAVMAAKAGRLLADKKGENYVDSAVFS